MEHIFIESKEIKKTLPFWLFYFFGTKRLLKKEWILENNRQFLCIPIPNLLTEKQKTRYLTKIIGFLKKKGIEKVYFEHTVDKDISKFIKQNFFICQGSELFFGFFPKILKQFICKKGYKPEECELIFISNNAKKVREYLLKCYKIVKKISIFTTNPASFSNVAAELQETYGMFLEIKGQNDTIKKYKTICINLEEERIVNKEFFKKTFLLDIYGLYQNAYQTILFLCKDKKTTTNQKKSLTRLEYELKYRENGAVTPSYEMWDNEKAVKIINITKM